MPYVVPVGQNNIVKCFKLVGLGFTDFVLYPNSLHLHNEFLYLIQFISATPYFQYIGSTLS